METYFKEIIKAIGEDPHRDGLENTPKRAATALKFLTHGYQQSVESVVNGAIYSHVAYKSKNV
ncbi:MAG: cyclohydrolase FolE [Gammaproteobacteria bacterium]|nr:cyclohydrolase FolE [Gammaproteobacteria bacterium]